MGWTEITPSVSSGEKFSFCGFLTSQTSIGFTPDSRGFQAGTLKQLQMRITSNSANTATYTISGTSTTNNTVSVGSSATGLFIDNTHSDGVSAGDNITVAQNASGQNPSITLIGFTFIATSNTVTRFGFKSGGGGSSANTRYYATLGESDPQTTESDAKIRIRKSFTVKNLGGLYGNNDSTFTVTSRRNGAAGNLSGTTAGGSPSSFSDTSHSDSVVLGDDWNFSYIDTGSFLTSLYANVDFISSNGDCIFVCAYSPSSSSSLGTATTNYYGLSGSFVLGAGTESDAQVQVNSAFVFDQLICNVPSGGNTISNASTFSLRAGSSDKISISIPGNNSGLFLDSSTQYQASTSDLMNYKIVTGGTGTSIEISFMSVNGNTSAQVVAGGPGYQHFRNTLKTKGRQAYNPFGGQMIVFG